MLSGFRWLPIPREQLLEPDDRGVGDASEHVGEPRLWIDVIELGAHDQAVMILICTDKTCRCWMLASANLLPPKALANRA